MFFLSTKVLISRPGTGLHGLLIASSCPDQAQLQVIQAVNARTSILPSPQLRPPFKSDHHMRYSRRLEHLHGLRQVCEAGPGSSGRTPTSSPLQLLFSTTFDVSQKYRPSTLAGSLVLHFESYQRDHIRDRLGPSPRGMYQKKVLCGTVLSNTMIPAAPHGSYGICSPYSTAYTSTADRHVQYCRRETWLVGMSATPGQSEQYTCF